MEVIRRDFLVPELIQILESARIDGTVAVQSRQTLQETEWLLDLASRQGRMRGVVGWVPLTEAGIGSLLEKLARHPKLKAVRHVLHDEADEAPISR